MLPTGPHAPWGPPPVVPAGTMVVELFSMSVSVNCHGPWLLCALSGVEYVYKPVDLMKGEHLTPEFIQMNPKHCVPTIRDSGVEMWESCAIMRYLCARYPECEAYYPADPAARARCDIALDFRQSTLYPNIRTLAYDAFGWAKAGADDLADARDAIAEPEDGALAVLCALLGPSDFLCGTGVSIADFAVAPALKYLEVTDVEFPAALQQYVKRFNDATNYLELSSDVSSFISSKKNGDAAGEAGTPAQTPEVVAGSLGAAPV